LASALRERDRSPDKQPGSDTDHKCTLRTAQYSVTPLGTT